MSKNTVSHEPPQSNYRDGTFNLPSLRQFLTSTSKAGGLSKWKSREFEDPSPQREKKFWPKTIAEEVLWVHFLSSWRRCMHYNRLQAVTIGVGATKLFITLKKCCKSHPGDSLSKTCYMDLIPNFPPRTTKAYMSRKTAYVVTSEKKGHQDRFAD